MGLKQEEQGQNWGRPEKARIPGGEQSFRAESMALTSIPQGREREKSLATWLWEARNKGPPRVASPVFIFTATQGGSYNCLPFADEKAEAQ